MAPKCEPRHRASGLGRTGWDGSAVSWRHRLSPLRDISDVRTQRHENRIEVEQQPVSAVADAWTLVEARTRRDSLMGDVKAPGELSGGQQDGGHGCFLQGTGIVLGGNISIIACGFVGRGMRMRAETCGAPHDMMRY